MTVSTVALDEVNVERRITLLRRSYRYDETVQLIDELLRPYAARMASATSNWKWARASTVPGPPAHSTFNPVPHGL